MLTFPFLMNENIDKFIDELSSSLRRETFVKLTLGNYKGLDEHLQKIQVRLIKTKKGTRLYFLYRSDNPRHGEELSRLMRAPRSSERRSERIFSAPICLRLKTTFSSILAKKARV